MIKENSPERVVNYDMTYRDDPIFEDYRIRREKSYNVRRPEDGDMAPDTSTGRTVRTIYNIVEEPVFKVDRSSETAATRTGNEDIERTVQRYNIVSTDPEPRSNWFRRLLKTFSNYGMNYDKELLQNLYAIPADPALAPKEETPADIYARMSQWRKKSNEDQSFFEKDLNVRREVLRKMAQQPELEDILDMMCNEAIVYDSDNAYICEPYLDTNIVETLTENAAAAIKDSIDKAFYKFYMMLDWKTRAWDEFKRYLIDGVLSYEIVYDSIEHPHQILGFVPLDPATLTKSVEDGTVYWYQYKDIVNKQRKLLDAQIIYIKYQDSGVVSRQSYLERLIRPFNIYRIVEQAQIIWTVTQASFKTVFTIPVGNQGKARGRQTINSAMAAYREDIAFDSESGELKINGKANMPFNKEYWLPQNENGKPEIETLTDQGPDLNDSNQLKYFKNELYKMSKIPPSRFDQSERATWFGTDAASMLRDEINFSRFINRVRNVFAQIMVKPLQLQLAMSIPEIKGDRRVLSAIGLRFVSYNQFEELMDIEVMQKRIDFIKSMQESLTTMGPDGEEISFFSSRYLAEKYLKLSNADLSLNEKYKKLEKETATGSDDEREDEGSEPERDMPEDDFGSDDFGNDMEQTESDYSDDMNAGRGPSDEEQSEFDMPY